MIFSVEDFLNHLGIPIGELGVNASAFEGVSASDSVVKYTVEALCSESIFVQDMAMFLLEHNRKVFFRAIPLGVLKILLLLGRGNNARLRLSALSLLAVCPCRPPEADALLRSALTDPSESLRLAVIQRGHLFLDHTDKEILAKLLLDPCTSEIGMGGPLVYPIRERAAQLLANL